ncbi:hypothetical protein NDA01_31260 [Trichocoleus desertorum AS-A10]|uniref:hypothetical protein n=1 Tax=Trichocoleus desertorum TaxID=1481672 RepID=UPI003299046B
MEHYLNFNLLGESHRFHISLPWSNLYIVNFNVIDAHLKSVVPEAIYERTRKLKPSDRTPEPQSIDFHSWLRQIQTNWSITMNPYQQELARLIGGQIHQAGLTHEGYPYLIVKQSNAEAFFYVIAQANPEGTNSGFLHITERTETPI